MFLIKFLQPKAEKHFKKSPTNYNIWLHVMTLKIGSFPLSVKVPHPKGFNRICLWYYMNVSNKIISQSTLVLSSCVLIHFNYCFYVNHNYY